jgi:hypothetical protein
MSNPQGASGKSTWPRESSVETRAEERYQVTALHPDDLADLEEKSGLSKETIESARIQSVPPDLLPKVITKALGYFDQRIKRAYEIPYFDADGRIITRQYKISPALTFSDGKTIKYLSTLVHKFGNVF